MAFQPVGALLQKARDLLMQGYFEAAASSVWQAFETGLGAACALKGFKLPCKQDVSSYQAQDLLNGLKTEIGIATVLMADWDAVLARREKMKAVVMNSYSHPSAPNIPRRKIVNSVDAVKKFLKLVRTK
jgi:hypothetical protein